MRIQHGPCPRAVSKVARLVNGDNQPRDRQKPRLCPGLPANMALQGVWSTEADGGKKELVVVHSSLTLYSITLCRQSVSCLHIAVGWELVRLLPLGLTPLTQPGYNLLYIHPT